MVEAIEFPHLAHKYDVSGVPKTVINETVQFVGAVTEAEFITQILNAESATP
jgi:predicted DsbA family dithiol-disulfide isomerase